MTDRICCDKCGRADASLRLVAFQYVYSVLLFTSQRAATGVWCGPCRRAEGWKYSLLTLVVGWWGIPWGPIFTLVALGRNALGGERPRDVNADLLAALGSQLLEEGNANEAAIAFEKSLALEDRPEVRRALLVAETQSGDAPRLETPLSPYRPGDVVLPAGDAVQLYDEAGGSQPAGSPVSGATIVLRSTPGWVELRVPGSTSGWASEGDLSPAEPAGASAGAGMERVT